LCFFHYRSKEKETVFYNGNKNTPYFSQKKKEHSITQIVNILLLKPDNARVCSERVIGCQENAAFVINAGLLDHYNDYRYDDNGWFRNHGYNTYMITFSEEDQTVTEIEKKQNKEADTLSLNKNQCLVKKTYYSHGVVKTFKKQTIEIVLHDGTLNSLVLLMYSFDGEPCSFKPAPHGNSKSQRPFIPSTASTMARIRQKVANSSSGPSKIFDEAFEQVGGIENLKAFSDVPRDSKQVKNVRSQLRNKCTEDEVAELIDFSQNSSFVHSVEVAPDLKVVLASAGQIRDLRDMCTDPLQYSVLGVDTTYNISKFCYLTPTVYKHLKLVDRKTGNHPTLLGPILIHNKMDSKTFQYFGNRLVELDGKLRDILFIGSDRDAAIDKGLKQAFPIASFLACQKHMADNIKSKLTELGVNGKAKKEYLKDIFGDEQQQQKGLVNSMKCCYL